jgi:hypothetical protein
MRKLSDSANEAGLRMERIRLVERYMIDAEEADRRALHEAVVECKAADPEPVSHPSRLVLPSFAPHVPRVLVELLQFARGYVVMVAGEIERPDPADLAPALIALAFAIGIGVAVAFVV